MHGQPDAEVVSPPAPQDAIQGHLLHKWSALARDPAAHCAHWISKGAPAGITVDFQLDGVLMPVVGEDPLEVDQLHSDPDVHINYRGVEDLSLIHI